MTAVSFTRAACDGLNVLAVPASARAWASRVRVREALEVWLEVRSTQVAARTARSDRELQRILPELFLAQDVRAARAADITLLLDHLSGTGLSRASVLRYRSSLSQFFAWCAAAGLVERSPVEDVAEMPAAPPTQISESFAASARKTTLLATGIVCQVFPESKERCRTPSAESVQRGAL